MRNFLLCSGVVFFAALLLFPNFLFAALVPCGGAGNLCSLCDFGILAINITNFLIYNIAIPLAGLMVVVGGIMLMAGSASEQRIATGKKLLTNAIIGIVIVFAAWLFVDTVIKVLTGDIHRRGFYGSFAPWNVIPQGECPFGGTIHSPNPGP